MRTRLPSMVALAMLMLAVMLGPGAHDTATLADGGKRLEPDRARAAAALAAQGEHALRIVRGVIDADGNVVAGEGFSIEHQPGERWYVITFDEPFDDLPSVSLTPVDTFGVTFNLLGLEPGLTRAMFRTRDGETAEPPMWTLTAIGRGPLACPADIDDDGEVAFGDLLRVLTDWGACP